MSDMLERVAKAHYERLHYTQWENLTPSTRDGFLAAMRAAIEAMRNPPLSILRVGERAWVEANSEHRKKMAEMRAKYGGIISTECVEIPFAWNAMIDSILKDGD